MPNLPSDRHKVDMTSQRKDLRTGGEKFADNIREPGMIRLVLMSSAASMLFMPSAWPIILPIAFAYHSWALAGNRRLPFRGPNSWEGVDYSDPHPKGDGSYQKSSGILHLGLDQAKREELWITNSDARRHGFILGTTGSGKALPLDELILTTRGWVQNGDIKPGDLLFHPDGGTTTVESVHPQGEIPAMRLWFEDGRSAVCSLDHLWEVTISPGKGGKMPIGVKPETKVMLAKDIAILSGAYDDKLSVTIRRISPYEGETHEGAELAEEDAILAAQDGFDALEYSPSSFGTPDQRISFLKKWVEIAAPLVEDNKNGGVRLKSLRASDAREIKRIVWSLGGKSSTWVPKRKKSFFERMKNKLGKEVKKDPHRVVGRLDITIDLPEIGRVFSGKSSSLRHDENNGTRIIGIEALNDKVEMSCIKTSRDDGLYIMGDFIVTHNTELLLGLVSQTFMWSSGFMFIDGKGTSVFYTRIWSLAKRFGREDDLRVINFTDIGGDPEAPAGGPGMMSNTANPFTKGDADQLMNILVSIMGGAGQGNDMWQNRAISLVGCLMKALVEMRQNNDIIMNVQVMREYLVMGTGVSKTALGNKARGVSKVEDIPDVAWDEMRTRAGMIELYLLALKGGYFSQGVVDAMNGFFGSLPGFSLDKALKGEPQDSKCNEQYNFLNMQLTKPLGTFADSFRHIFMTPVGEVDLEDVMLNRRILIVLLPALQKAEPEMQNCGKVVVSLVKIMMGNADPGKLEGSRRKVRDSSPTNSSSPFIVVLDEVGYYMVAGIDVMMAQARSLGFMIILAGQDMAAMQKVNKELAEITSANASIFAAGKTVDGARTLEVIQKLFGKAKVSVASGYEKDKGAFSTRMIPRKDVSFEDVERVALRELQGLQPGEFYYLFDGELARSNTFYVGDFDDRIEYMIVNKFIVIRGPKDQVPNLDQSQAMRFSDGYIKSMQSLYDFVQAPPQEVSYNDDITLSVGVADKMRDMIRSKGKQPSAKQVNISWIGGALASISEQDYSEYELTAEEDTFEDEDLNEDIGEAIRRALDEDMKIRHTGNMDLLISQQKAKDLVKKHTKPEVLAAEEETTPEMTGKEYFNKVSDNWEKIQMILARADEVTEDGLNIIRQTGASKRAPYNPDKDMSASLDPLERMVYDEAARKTMEADDPEEDNQVKMEGWFEQPEKEKVER